MGSRGQFRPENLAQLVVCATWPANGAERVDGDRMSTDLVYPGE
jgi:hypothetical protein